MIRISKDTIFGGVVYLHDINDGRFNTLGRYELTALRASFGQSTQSLERLVLVTTKWGRLADSDNAATEKQLMENQWDALIRRGARVFRFENKKGDENAAYDSAWKIVDHLLSCKSAHSDIIKQLRDFKKLPPPKEDKLMGLLNSIIRLLFEIPIKNSMFPYISLWVYFFD